MYISLFNSYIIYCSVHEVQDKTSLFIVTNVSWKLIRNEVFSNQYDVISMKVFLKEIISFLRLLQAEFHKMHSECSVFLKIYLFWLWSAILQSSLLDKTGVNMDRCKKKCFLYV